MYRTTEVVEQDLTKAAVDAIGKLLAVGSFNAARMLANEIGINRVFDDFWLEEQD